MAVVPIKIWNYWVKSNLGIPAIFQLENGRRYMLSFTDFEPSETTAMVLGYLFKNILKRSQIVNLS